MSKIPSDSSGGARIFPSGYRGSGVLVHVTSLPSRFGVGDLGSSASDWVNLLAESNQGWWQMLPLGPPERGNSPYEPFSTFAGNELLICPDRLIADGLIAESDLPTSQPAGMHVDFDAVGILKDHLLERAETNFRKTLEPGRRRDYDEFCQAHGFWLDDYALFRALKIEQQGADYHDWPAPLANREASALAAARGDLAGLIDQFRFRQFQFFRQMEALRDFAHEKGVRLIGDVPFFVSPDSSDVWANPELFLLDENRRLLFSAGVPPDYFSPDGQFWGDPLYDWNALRQTGYRWWIERLRVLLSLVDVVRLDHFRAFAAAWHIPAGATSAKSGHWEPGPAGEFFDAVQGTLGPLPLIAEDLGLITADVLALRDKFHFPGMRVLQFAFDGHADNPFLPENYVHDTVVYTGTHDNNTSRGWFNSLPDEQRQVLATYLNELPPEREIARRLMELSWRSQAALSIAPLQDVLNLGGEARMNVPGNPLNNWRWRCPQELLTREPFLELRKLTQECGRG